MKSARNNQKKAVILIGLIIIVVIIGLFIWGLRRQTNHQKVQTTNQNKQTNTVRTNIVDMESFKKMASQANCADKRNDLYMIDNKMVFWIREGNCPDASYSYSLYYQTPQDNLCRSMDSFAGPKKSCTSESYSSLFETLTSNLNDSELGVGSTHRVEKILIN